MSQRQLTIFVLTMLVMGCDSTDIESSTYFSGSGLVQASVNGVMYTFEDVLAFTTGDGAFSLAGTHCPVDNEPLNYTLSFRITSLREGTYPIDPPDHRNSIALFDMTFDEVNGLYNPVHALPAQIRVLSYNSRTRRAQGQFSGTFYLPYDTGDPLTLAYRTWPDTLVVDGEFDVLVGRLRPPSQRPIDETSVRHYPCDRLLP